MIRIVTSGALLALALAAGVQAGDKALAPELFLAKAIDCSFTEKDLAEKAVKNAQSEDVRKFAQRLVDDHAKLNRRATDLAKDLKIGVVTATSKEHKEVMAKLLTAKGKDYDRVFIEHMVKSHEEALKMCEGQAKTGSRQEIKTFASEAVPIIRGHLEQARKLEKQLR
jgi:putative membrane protein